MLYLDKFSYEIILYVFESAMDAPGKVVESSLASFLDSNSSVVRRIPFKHTFYLLSSVVICFSPAIASVDTVESFKTKALPPLLHLLTLLLISIIVTASLHCQYVLLHSMQTLLFSSLRKDNKEDHTNCY